MGSVLLTAVFIALNFATGLANPDSKRLYDDLLSNYNRLIRPVGNNSDRLTVKMGLRLSQLIDVNLKNQIMTTNVWVEQVSALDGLEFEFSSPQKVDKEGPFEYRVLN